MSQMPCILENRSSPMKSMEVMAKGVKVGNTAIYDMETIFLRLLTVGQARQMELAPMFQYELCAVPPLIIDEYGCPRKGSKSPLVLKLGVVQQRPTLPDMLFVDAQQLLYHVVWPIGGTPVDLAASMKARVEVYSDAHRTLVFDKYQEISPKDHERTRRAGVGTVDYNLNLQTILPRREAIMKNKNNKRELSALLSRHNYGKQTTVESQSDGLYGHGEADITILSFVLKAASKGHKVIRVLSDDTGIFCLLVYWVYKMNIMTNIQMENWEGRVLCIKYTCKNLGAKCLQLLGMHYLTGSDITSYLYGKGKVSALKSLIFQDFTMRLVRLVQLMLN